MLDGKCFERRDHVSVASPGNLVYIRGIQIMFTKSLNSFKNTSSNCSVHSNKKVERLVVQLGGYSFFFNHVTASE